MNITANYGAFSLGCPKADRSHQYTWYRSSGTEEHLGIDLAASKDALVYAIADGKVLYQGTLWGAVWKGVVLVEHYATNGQRFTAVYGHLNVARSPITGVTWAVGDVVRRSDRIDTIATITAGGSDVGPHVHFGVATGAQSSVPGTSNSGCAHSPGSTVDPLPYLGARTQSALAGSIVGWRNANGSITSWRVTSTLRRNWIPNTTVYWCLRNRGAIDRGPQSARFLDQLPDQNGVHATC